MKTTNTIPKNCTIIEGFPGFGLVGTITTGFLIDHLKCEHISHRFFEETAPTVAIHQGRTVDPIGVFYNKDYNIVIVHSILNPQGLEWKAADHIIELCKLFKAKELITLEGVSGPQVPDAKQRAFYFVDGDDKALRKTGMEPLKEGIIIGVTGALMLKNVPCKLTSLFAETHSSLPDSKAAAIVIAALDKYLNLDVDTKPLLKQAEEFESKLKQLMQQGVRAKEQQDRKNLSYIS